MLMHSTLTRIVVTELAITGNFLSTIDLGLVVGVLLYHLLAHYVLLY